jgi:hypothetical protein
MVCVTAKSTTTAPFIDHERHDLLMYSVRPRARGGAEAHSRPSNIKGLAILHRRPAMKILWTTMNSHERTAGAEAFEDEPDPQLGNAASQLDDWWS